MFFYVHRLKLFRRILISAHATFTFCLSLTFRVSALFQFHCVLGFGFYFFGSYRCMGVFGLAACQLVLRAFYSRSVGVLVFCGALDSVLLPSVGAVVSLRALIFVALGSRASGDVLSSALFGFQTTKTRNMFEFRL